MSPKPITVLDEEIRINSENYILLTDMLRSKEGHFFISDWLRNRNTLEYLGFWERVHNPDFNYGEFATITSRAGLNSYKINYRIHTDAVKENLIPAELTPAQTSRVYASEADLLNMALFGKTAKQWRDENPSLQGNMRDYANVSQLVCLANLETLNAHFIQQAIAMEERLKLLNQTAIQPMRLLTDDHGIEKLEGGKA